MKLSKSPSIPSLLFCMTLIMLQGHWVDAKLLGVCSSCGVNASCFGLKTAGGGQFGGDCKIDSDPDCGDCEAAFIFSALPSGSPAIVDVLVNFDTKISGYAAAGVSPINTGMQNLLVFLCNKNPQGQLLNSVRWVDGFSTPVVEPTNPVIPVKSAQEINGIARCMWSIPPKVTVGVIEFDFLNKDYHKLSALLKGDCGGSDFCKHTKVFKTAEPGKINAVAQLNSQKRIRLFTRLHGCLEIIAFIGLMPIATIIARYFKETWTGKKYCGKGLWYRLHVGILLTSLACAILGYIFILAYKDFSPFNFGDSKSVLTHAIIGLTALVGFLSQVILHFVITPQCPGLLKKYKKVHAVVGGLTYILGMLNIMLTSFLLSEPNTIFFTTLIWFLVHLIIYISLTCALYKTDKDTDDSDYKRALLAYPMPINFFMEDAPGAPLRKIFLGILCIAAVIVTVVLIVFVATA